MTEVIEVPAFDLSMKKKKKKVVKKEDEITEGLENLELKEKGPKEPEIIEEAAGGEEAEGAEGGDLDFSKLKKKKKTKKVTIKEDGDESVPAESSEPAETSDSTNGDADSTQVPATSTTSSSSSPSPWLGSDRDYTYEELATRIFNMLHNSNPELAKTKRYVMKPPQVCREGTKKTVWINFAEICSIMRRKPDHVLNYVLAELGTNGSVDGSQRLVIKGRFQPKGLENVLRHYISEYVACRTCKSPDTVMQKENRLYFLCCEACGSRRSVTAIKKGFEAQIGKRKKGDK